MKPQEQISIARLYDNHGNLHGAGVLISDSHILTCAHVVAAALGISETDAEKPKALIDIDFPLSNENEASLSPKSKYQFRVLQWYPILSAKELREKKLQDIAVLQLVEGQILPAEIEPQKLVSFENQVGDEFAAFGFPKNHNAGIWAHGKISRERADGWIIVEGEQIEHYWVDKGFSGTPVWNSSKGAYVGIVVAKEGAEGKLAAFFIPTSVLIHAWPEIWQATYRDNPYKGLSPFSEDDTDNFFGRADLVEELKKLTEYRRFVLVTGPSGVGKSSLIYAGLIPQLRKDERQLIAHFQPKSNPLDNLAYELLSMIGSDQQSRELHNQIDHFKQELLQSNFTLLARYVKQILGKHSDERKLILFIDQFEELFASAEQEIRAFIEAVKVLSGQHQEINCSDVTVLLAIRTDFTDAATNYQLLPQGFTESFTVGPLTSDQLRAAIEEPAARLHVKFEHGLIETILGDLDASERDDAGNIPLMQFTLEKLWNNQKKPYLLTHDAYETTGGVQESIAKHADEVFQHMFNSNAKLFQKIFFKLIRVIDPQDLGSAADGNSNIEALDANAVILRRPGSTLEFTQDQLKVIQQLADKKLLTTSRDESTKVEFVEIVHEALLRNWSTLNDWINDHQSNLKSWDKLRGRLLDEELLRGRFLKETKALLNSALLDLSPAEKKFIKRSHRVFWGFRVGLGIGIVVLFSVIGFGYQEIDRQTRISRAEEWIADIGVGKGAVSFRSALQASIKSLDSYWNYKAEQVLREVLGLTLPMVLTSQFHSHQIQSISFASDGNSFSTASYDNSTIVTDTSSWQTVSSSPDPSRNEVVGVISPSGNEVVTSSSTQPIKVWSVSTALMTLIEEIPDSAGMNPIGLNDSGSLLAAADNSIGKIMIWQFGLWSEPIRILDVKTIVTAIRINPDGNTVAVGSVDGALTLWSLETGGLTSSNKLQGRISDIDFSPDGLILAVGSHDKTARTFSVHQSDLVHLDTFVHADQVLSVNLSSDASFLATGSQDHTARIWDLILGRERSRLLHNYPVTAVSLSPTGDLLLSGDQAGFLSVWDMTEMVEPEIKHRSLEQIRWFDFSKDGTLFGYVEQGRREGPNTSVTLSKVDSPGVVCHIEYDSPLTIPELEISSNNELIAIANSTEKRVEVRQIDFIFNDCPLIDQIQHMDPVTSIDLGPEDRLLATGSMDSKTRIWDLSSSLENPIREYSHDDVVLSVSLNNHGNLIASTGFDNTVRIWDVNLDKLVGIYEPEEVVDGFYDLVFAPSRDLVAIASSDRSIRIYDVQKDKEIHKLDTGGIEVVSLDFSNDGKLLSGASTDGIVSIWEWENPIETKRLQSRLIHGDWVRSVAFHPNIRSIASAGHNGLVSFWISDYRKLIREACNRADQSYFDDLSTQACSKYEQ